MRLKQCHEARTCVVRVQRPASLTTATFLYFIEASARSKSLHLLCHLNAVHDANATDSMLERYGTTIA